MLGLRGLLLIPKVRYIALIAPDRIVPQMRHCAARREAEGTAIDIEVATAGGDVNVIAFAVQIQE
jgi:hypothetical protein